MPLLDRELFLKVLNNIFHISLITVHSDMMKKLEIKFITLENPKITTYSKSLNVRHSIRKKSLIDNEPLIKTDVHALFVEAFKVNWKINALAKFNKTSDRL
jgi:hypothetical protein